MTNGKYDYPKNGIFLNDISKNMFGIKYIETTKTQERKIKRVYREVNGVVTLKEGETK